eukprot:TRINITY_DN9609_c1_g3_i3.p1 TRINITY_DN9609_c1_g3~~TRINITY_DN9609_c1_g3_i3.p1  ORF type:complete len:266 (+),score=44.59 TRINITY_DN9609_c1_g3_i3:82-879(+)
MVLQQVLIVSSVSLVGFFVGLVSNNKNHKKSRRIRQSRQPQKCCQSEQSEELEDEVSGEEDQMHVNRTGDKFQSVQKYEQNRRYVAQQTFKYQQVSQSQGQKKVEKTKKQGKKQQQKQKRNFSRTVSAPVGVGFGVQNGKAVGNPRDPLVDTLFKEIQLLIKEKASMQGEIDNLSLQVQQLGELVTYLQMERDQESAEGNSEAGGEEEMDTLQWLSGVSSSNQEEFFQLNSPTSHENFPAALYSQDKKTVAVPSQYQLAVARLWV